LLISLIQEITKPKPVNALEKMVLLAPVPKIGNKLKQSPMKFVKISARKTLDVKDMNLRMTNINANFGLLKP